MAQVTRTSEEILPEDRVTNALIEKTSGQKSVEVPYNNYGERGYVDLVINTVLDETLIMEIKSNPKSANSVLRQFRKMKSNFEEGSEFNFNDKKTYLLVFTASNVNLEHIKNNKEMYQTLKSNVYMADETGNLKLVCKDSELNKDELSSLSGIRFDNELVCPYCGKEYKMEAYYKKHVKNCNVEQATKISGVEA